MAKLSPASQEHARRSFRLFVANPRHPGLSFKKVDDEENVYSVRIGRGLRALGTVDGDDVTWFWVGHHDEYERILRG